MHAIWNLKLKFQSKLELCSGNHVVYRQTDGRTDRRTRWIQYIPPPTSLGGGIITCTKKEVHVDRTLLTNEWTDRCVMLETGSGHLAATLHSQSTRKKRCDWTWKCKHRLQWRISIIVMEFFGDPIVPDGKISGTAGSSSGTAGYVRKGETSIPPSQLHWSGGYKKDSSATNYLRLGYAS